MKLTKSRLKRIIKEEIANIQNEGIGDKALGALRKTQQFTGIAKKPWTHAGDSNSLTTMIDDLLSNEFKGRPALKNVGTAITVSGTTSDEYGESATINAASFNAALYKPKDGEIYGKIASFTGRNSAKAASKGQRDKLAKEPNLDLHDWKGKFEKALQQLSLRGYDK